MNLSYNDFITPTGSWSKSPSAPYQYQKILSGIILNDNIITFNNLPANMTVANPPTRTDPADRAIAQIIFKTNNVGIPASIDEDTHPPIIYDYPFDSNLTFSISRINCISGSRDQYANYLAPVDLNIINTTSGNMLMPNMQNVSGCIMYQYIKNANMTGISGAIFLTGNGQSYLLTGNYTGAGYTNISKNSFFTQAGIDEGPYIADYKNEKAVFHFYKYPIAFNPIYNTQQQFPYVLEQNGIPYMQFFSPDEILSSYIKISDNSIRVDDDMGGLAQSLRRLHVLFNRS